MYSQRLHETTESVDKDYGRLYRNVMREFKYTVNVRSGHRYFSMLWASVAPKGSIYRRNGLYAEHRKHSEDLWRQLGEIADRHKDLLGGAAVPREERADRLFAALKEVEVVGCVLPDDAKREAIQKKGSVLRFGHSSTSLGQDEETVTGDLGFLPLEEWLRTKVYRVGPFLLDADADRRSDEVKHFFMAVGIFGLQVIAPFLIFLNRWNTKTNYLKDWDRLKRHLTMGQLACLGMTMHAVLTTVMGVLLLFVIIFMVRCYVQEQLTYAAMSSRLPTDACWFLAGIFANAWSCCFICMTIPLLFWSEQTPTNIVLDSMTLLFLFKLDDLSDILCSYLNMSDEDFQRLAAWNSALLSQCPLHVEDLVVADAKSLDELWSIQYDRSGRLCRTKGGNCLMRLTHRFAEEQCDERTPIASKEMHHDGSRILYRPCRGWSYELPTTLALSLSGMWHVISWLLAIAQYVIPIGWYLINKRCSKD